MEEKIRKTKIFKIDYKELIDKLGLPDTYIEKFEKVVHMNGTDFLIHMEDEW